MEMTLKEAIKRAKRVECMIHVSDGWSTNAKISKVDALEACKQYLYDVPTHDYDTWENEHGSIIAMAYGMSEDGKTIGCLNIGR